MVPSYLQVKRTRAASYFNMFVKDQVELFNQQRKAQAEDDAKAGKEPCKIHFLRYPACCKTTSALISPICIPAHGARPC